MPRFDIGPAAEFESRDGGLGTGGLIRNGFVEKAPGGVWSWQRPGLAPGQAAPFTGTALGMLALGTSLYGIGNNGTATSFTIVIPRPTSFTLVAGLMGTSPVTYGYITPSVGSLSPASWNGATVGLISSSNITAAVLLLGSYASTFLKSVRVGGVIAYTAVATYSYNGTTSQTYWAWPGLNLVPAPGSYSGAFR